MFPVRVHILWEVSDGFCEGSLKALWRVNIQMDCEIAVDEANKNQVWAIGKSRWHEPGFVCSYCGKLILKRLSKLGDTFGGKMGVFHNQLNIHIVA